MVDATCRCRPRANGERDAGLSRDLEPLGEACPPHIRPRAGLLRPDGALLEFGDRAAEPAPVRGLTRVGIGGTGSAAEPVDARLRLRIPASTCGSANEMPTRAQCADHSGRHVPLGTTSRARARPCACAVHVAVQVTAASSPAAPTWVVTTTRSAERSRPTSRETSRSRPSVRPALRVRRLVRFRPAASAVVVGGRAPEFESPVEDRLPADREHGTRGVVDDEVGQASALGRAPAGEATGRTLAAVTVDRDVRATTQPASAQGVSAASTASRVTTVPVRATCSASSGDSGIVAVDRGGIGSWGSTPDAIGPVASIALHRSSYRSLVTKSSRLRALTPSGPSSSTSGENTAARSASCARGVRSAATRPSITKLPSCTGSPKSPPYIVAVVSPKGTWMPCSSHSHTNPPMSRGCASNRSWYSVIPPGPVPIACTYSHCTNGIARRRASSAGSSSAASSIRPMAATSSCDAYMRDQTSTSRHSWSPS